MKKGVWHQLGYRGQRLACEQIDAGVGAGVIISPRDLRPQLAIEYAEEYRNRGAEVAIDPQFHVVGHTVGKLEEWPFNHLRTSVSDLRRIGDEDFAQLTGHLVEMNGSIHASAVIAPALIYEAGRPDVVDANRRLFEAARRAGEELGIPTWGTVVIGRSAAVTDRTLSEALSHATSVPAAGWYFAVEFDGARVPNDEDQVLRAATGLLGVAAGGRPVLNAFSGPLGLVGVAAGATGVTVAPAQNLWQFRRARLEPPQNGGGGGDAPPRLFCRRLWGTVVYPDEVALLPEELAKGLVDEGPFATPLAHRAPFPELSRWNAGRHLVWLMGSELQRLFEIEPNRERCEAAISLLADAVELHEEIRRKGVTLKDDTNSYQGPWQTALTRLLDSGSDHYLAMELMR